VDVEFVDTSVLTNLCRVPDKDERYLEAAERLEAVWNEVQLIIPVTAVIETGNHIEQAKHDGRERAARMFEKYLRSMMDDETPWVLHEVLWGADFLSQLCDGPSPVPGLVQMMMSKQLGAGDMAILVERRLYMARTRIPRVDIWTYDERLRAYS